MTGALELQLVDAFAEAPFTGNPAAVVLLDERRSDRWMQRVAMEMNQAETAFLLRQEGGFSLRWFTPVAEVDLCGHATLASAHVLWSRGHVPHSETIVFATRSGVLTARDTPTGIELDFPAIQSTETAPPADVAAALGAAPQHVLQGAFDLICVLSDGAAVRALQPDLRAIAAWPVRGVLVTALADGVDHDFVSRCFFPALGVPEDPVTGSAHCALAVYWRGVLGRDDLAGYQASARGGVVRCRVRGDRVTLAGRALTTLAGTLLV